MSETDYRDNNPNDFYVPADEAPLPGEDSGEKPSKDASDEKPDEREADAGQEDGEDASAESASEDDSEDSEDSDEAEEEAPKKGKPDRARAREAHLARLARRKAEEAEARVAQLEEFIRSSMLQRNTVPESEKLEKPARPDPNRFQLKEWDPEYAKAVEEYQQKYEEYLIGKAREESRSAAEAAAREAQRAREDASLQVKAQQIGKRGLDKYKDFREVVEDAFEAMPPSPEAEKILVELENAEDVLYHLGQHPDELERITALGPMAQALELGKLSARLASRQKAAAKVTKSKPTPQTPRGANGKFTKAEDARYDKFLRAAQSW
jgi:hypothetical protein